MKTILKLSILALSLAFAVSSCKKGEEETPVETDLTTSIVGNYNADVSITGGISSDTSSTVVVNVTKKNNSSVNIKFTDVYGAQWDIVANVSGAGNFKLNIPKETYPDNSYHIGVVINALETADTHGFWLESDKSIAFKFRTYLGDLYSEYHITGIKQ